MAPRCWRSAAAGGGPHGGAALGPSAAVRARPDQCGADGAGAAPGGRRARPRIAAARVACRGTRRLWPFRHPLDYIGDGRRRGHWRRPGSVASAPRWRCAAAGRLPVAVCGDGDFLMGVTALWTAVHYRHSAAGGGRQQPLVLQRRTAPGARGAHAQPAGGEPLDRPAHRRSGDRPRTLARAQGAKGLGPVTDAGDLAERSSREAIAAVEGGAVAVVDVRVAPGYSPAATAGLFRT